MLICSVVSRRSQLMNLPELDGLGGLSEFGIHSLQSTVGLRKALYGLKQAPRLWHQEIEGFLKSIGFTQSVMEPNLYISNTVLVLCVDDILPAYKSLEDILSIKAKLMKKYRMTDVVPVRRFLGLDVEKYDSGYTFHQTTYIDNVGHWEGRHPLEARHDPCSRHFQISHLQCCLPSHQYNQKKEKDHENRPVCFK